ncbi:hypothetical protein [Anabaena sp. AL09]|jgi:type I restriction enzyme S subunit|uniref:hypothetical protein n=1 Tax=Anabaena sp. AL09 TaxID=1710891 RepID=UPI0007FB8F96|nr:hypothetical protein [Anabaena sp. AL09]OBQ11865.1 MAG: hypothetical protein AN490_05020 [Anabaena sp. AL09]
MYTNGFGYIKRIFDHKGNGRTILSYFDDKIEINNRINSELENLAKTIYDYWFVQFDFPDENGKPYKSSGGKMVYNQEFKREIPAGWEVKKLGNFGVFKNGVNYDPSQPGERLFENFFVWDLTPADPPNRPS